MLRPRFVGLWSFVVGMCLATPALAGEIFSNDFETGTTCHWSDTGPHTYCWSNPAGGDWNVAGNWRDGVVPPYGADVGIEFAGPKMTVTISAADVYVHSLTAVANITVSGRALNVSGASLIDGHLTASSGSTISATGLGTTFVADDTPSSLAGVILSSTAGGSLTMSSLTSLTGGHIALDGATSSIHLPALVGIDESWLTATNGAQLSLPLVTSMTCSSTSKACYQNGYLLQAYGAGSTITMAGLTSMTVSTGGLLYADAEGGGRVNLPSLSTVALSNGSNLQFYMSGSSGGFASEIDLNALPTLSAAASMVVANGAKLAAPALATVAGTISMSGSGNTFTAPITTITGSVTVAGATVSLPGITTFAGATITVNAGGALTLGGNPNATGATVTLSAGGSLTASGLTSLTGGKLGVDGATSSLSLGALANVNDTFIVASNGGHVSLPSVTSMTCGSTSKPCYQQGYLFEAYGAGSSITMAALTTVAASTGGTLYLDAESGGRLNFAALTTVSPSNGTNLQFYVSGAGGGSPSELDLTVLPTLPASSSMVVANGAKVAAPDLATLVGTLSMSGSGNSFSAGLTTISGPFTVAGATVSLPGITTFAGATISVGAGGSLTLGGNPNATGGTLSVSAGGSLTASGLTSLTGGKIGVDGATSSLSLPALANVNDTFIVASNGGHVSLPSVTSMTCSSTSKPCYQQGYLFESYGAGSTITMAALTTVAASTGGTLYLDAETGGRLNLTALTTVSPSNGTNLQFYVSGSGGGSPSELDLDVLATLPASSSMVIANGAKVAAPDLATLVGSLTMSGSGNTFSSALSTISGPFTVAGATVSLPGITTFAGTTIAVGAGGSLTLGGNPTATGATLSISAGGSLTASGLTSLTGGKIGVDGATSTLSLPALTNINDTYVVASNGGHLSLPAVTSMTCSSTSKPCYQQGYLFEAYGAGGTTITMAALTTITVTTGNTLYVDAESSGRVKLQALTTVNTTSTNLQFYAAGASSEIDLDTLGTGGYDAGHVTFVTLTGGTIIHPSPFGTASGTADALAAGPPGVLAKVDLDGDGKADTIAIAPGSGELEVVATAGPDGSGITTSYAVGSPTQALAIGDWDDDGALDLALGDSESGAVLLLSGVGDGTFGDARRVPLPFVPGSIVVRDVDRDGIPDLVVRSLDGARWTTLLGRGDGAFTAQLIHP